MFIIVVFLSITLSVCATKYTVAAERDPLGGLAFLNRYFGTFPSSDSCPGNVCVCSKGDNNATTDTFTLIGRASLPEPEYMRTHTAGTCILATKFSGLKDDTEYTAIRGIETALVGNDCTYSYSQSLIQAQGDTGYIVVAHTPDQCCKACAAEAACVGATYKGDVSELEYANDSWTLQMPRAFDGFGLHLVGRLGTRTSGGRSVGEVEAIIDHKLGNMTSFDSWMDFNVAFLTNGLDSYVTKFETAGIPYLATRWSARRWGTMLSVFVRVPKSQLIIELVGRSSTSKLIANRRGLTTLEQRLSDRMLDKLSWLPSGSSLEAVKISRAATDLDALDKFYIDGLGLRSVSSLQEAKVSSRCYMMAWGPDLCFVKRSPDATRGTFKVADMESNLVSVRKATSTNPRCNQNRWVDNHFDGALASYDGLKRMARNSELNYQCTKGGLQYIYDPTGWAVQVGPLDDDELTQLLPGCSESFPLKEDSINFCGDSNCTCSVQEGLSFIGMPEHGTKALKSFQGRDDHLALQAQTTVNLMSNFDDVITSHVNVPHMLRAVRHRAQ